MRQTACACQPRRRSKAEYRSPPVSYPEFVRNKLLTVSYFSFRVYLVTLCL